MPRETAQIRILPAQENQAALILSYVKKLAEYEKLASRVIADEQLIKDSLFGARPAAEAVIAYVGDEPAGMALFFHNYSTFTGRAGVYLEDLFVDPPFRGKGVGKALLVHLAQITTGRGCARLDWAVLDWNEPAIKFYRSIGAEPLDDWTVYRLTGPALANLAQPI